MWQRAVQPEGSTNTKNGFHNKKLEATWMQDKDEPGHAGPEKGLGALNQNLSSMCSKIWIRFYWNLSDFDLLWYN